MRKKYPLEPRVQLNGILFTKVNFQNLTNDYITPCICLQNRKQGVMQVHTA